MPCAAARARDGLWQTSGGTSENGWGRFDANPPLFGYPLVPPLALALAPPPSPAPLPVPKRPAAVVVPDMVPEMTVHLFSGTVIWASRFRAHTLFGGFRVRKQHIQDRAHVSLFSGTCIFFFGHTHFGG